MKFPHPHLKTLSHRDQIGNWLNGQGLTGKGVEVGVLFGGYSAIILSQWRGHLLCVDPWVNQPKETYHDGMNLLNMEEVYQQAVRNLGHLHRATVVRKFSLDAAAEIPDGSLDFVYLDGNHALPAIRADIAAWWPKVKIGGLFAGHDFNIRYDNDTNSDAQTAVMEFSEKVDVWPQVAWCMSWWFIKTQEMVDRYHG
jgi:hypothetical protein